MNVRAGAAGAALVDLAGSWRDAADHLRDGKGAGKLAGSTRAASVLHEQGESSNSAPVLGPARSALRNALHSQPTQA